jgi:hypothetical protein
MHTYFISTDSNKKYFNFEINPKINKQNHVNLNKICHKLKAIRSLA